jgi:7,8-dihydropterin-6-yl-methyl-4-(beta-D-ribofuranosyl)aminobenzene 5'-phosphate synthase
MSQPELTEIDECEALVLVDNVSDPLSTVPQGVTSEIPNLLRAGAKELAGSCMCCAQWGLSLVLTASVGDRHATLLFDSGPEGYGIERNGARLGVAFETIDAVVLSHGHFDHVGGMTTALGLISRAKGGRPTPVHVNAGMFVARGTIRVDGSLLPHGKVPSPAELEAVGGELVVSGDARTLLDGTFYLSGEIPRVTPFEQGLKGQVRATPDGRWVPDELILDERFLAIHLRGRGIFVFTACSHAGVVNVLTHAREVFDPIPIYGVMGGFHLSGSYAESIIPETIEGLQQFGLERLVPGHCTGWRATARLVETFGEARVTPSAVGQRHAI